MLRLAASPDAPRNDGRLQLGQRIEDRRTDAAVLERRDRRADIAERMASGTVIGTISGLRARGSRLRHHGRLCDFRRDD